jgi:hypothetical protein
MASLWVLALLAVVSVAVAVTHGRGKSPPRGSKLPPSPRYGRKRTLQTHPRVGINPQRLINSTPRTTYYRPCLANTTGPFMAQVQDMDRRARSHCPVSHFWKREYRNFHGKSGQRSTTRVGLAILFSRTSGNGFGISLQQSWPASAGLQWWVVSMCRMASAPVQ